MILDGSRLDYECQVLEHASQRFYRSLTSINISTTASPKTQTIHKRGQHANLVGNEGHLAT